MLTELKYSRPDGTFVGVTPWGDYHVTERTPFWDEAVAMAAIEMPPLEPVPEPVILGPEETLATMSPVSHAQIIAALIMSDIITEAEGVAWISGTLPDAVEAMIAGLPADQRIIARLRAIRPTSVIPSDPLVAALAAAQGKGAQDMVDLFTLAASL